MITKVSKRDGRVVNYNKKKIFEAMSKAFMEVDGSVTDEAFEIIGKIIATLENSKKEQMDVEDIQDYIEKALMNSRRKDVAKKYIIYRSDRDKVRNRKRPSSKEFEEKILGNKDDKQNANVDGLSFGGRKGEAANVIQKQYALDYCMSDMARNNHLSNEIYIHDLDSYAVGMHNCLSIPFDDLLANGFNTRQTDVRPANSINTAFQLVAVIFQLQSLQQFGGVSATHLDWTMIPYIRKSFYKHYLNGCKYIEDQTDSWMDILKNDLVNNNPSIDDDIYFDKESKAYQYAMDMTIKETKQAVEGMYHNLNTLQSRSGNQLPFTSINYGTCTLPEGRMVIKALLEGSIKGVGKFHKTSIFPCGIFQCMKGVNRKPGEPNYDLYQLALKSTAQRLYPNYANVDWSGNEGYDRNDPKTYFSTMGLVVILAHLKSFEHCQVV